MKSNIGNRRTFSGAAFSKKSLQMTDRVSLVSITKRRRISVKLEDDQIICIAIDYTVDYKDLSTFFDIRDIDVTRDRVEEERLEKLTMKLP